MPTILRMSLDAILGLADFLDDVPRDAETVRIPEFPTAEDLLAVTGDAERDWRTEQLLSRLAARAALRDRMGIAVVRLEGAAYRQWLAGRVNAPVLQAEYLHSRTEVVTGVAALRALGLPLEVAKPLGKLRPPVGSSLAARLARWVMREDSSPEELESLAGELLQKRQDGAIRILQEMLEPEDFGFIAHAIDEMAAQAELATPDGPRPGFVFLIPAVRAGEGAPPPVPASLAARLAGLKLGGAFGHIGFAPFLIETDAILALTPSQLRQVATALAAGQPPPVQPAGGAATEVALLGIAAGAGEDDDLDSEESEEAFSAGLQAWGDAIQQELGLVAEEPVFLSRARDILRRVELAIPDEGMDGGGDLEADAAAVAALAQYVAQAGQGLAAVVFEDGSSETYRIADGLVAGNDTAALDHGLAEALSTGGTLLVFARREAGGFGLTGYELVRNVIRPLSSAEVRGMAAAFAEALGGAPVEAAEAPMLEYDPG